MSESDGRKVERINMHVYMHVRTYVHIHVRTYQLNIDLLLLAC